MKPPITKIDIIAKAKQALATFGTYAFDDKGPHEVMDVASIAAILRRQPPSEAASTIREVNAAKELKQGRRNQRLASAIVQELEDWDALFVEPEIETIYDQ